MSRLEISFRIFSKEGIKFLFLELIIVFLGVYLAFLFQSYSEQRKIDAEKEKVLIGLKEDLEYFRIFFPDYAGAPEAEEWRKLASSGEYNDFSTWRFIQPQHDYTAIEYALSLDAEIIDFELNSVAAEIYQELKKLEHVEIILTELAMRYTAIPEGNASGAQIEMAEANNLLNFKRFADRYADRARIMLRIAEMSEKELPAINENFTADELKEIELVLLKRNISLESEEQIDFYVNVIKQFFPNLTEEEIRSALQ